MQITLSAPIEQALEEFEIPLCQGCGTPFLHQEQIAGSSDSSDKLYVCLLCGEAHRPGLHNLRLLSSEEWEEELLSPESGLSRTLRQRREMLRDGGPLYEPVVYLNGENLWRLDARTHEYALMTLQTLLGNAGISSDQVNRYGAWGYTYTQGQQTYVLTLERID